MEQNNFEKQVQEKVEELKIHPSEAAWDNIEKRIGQNNGRKRLIFLLWIIIPLVLFTAFYLRYNSGKPNILNAKNENIAIAKNKSNPSIEKPVQLEKNVAKTEEKIERKDAEVKFKTYNSKKSQDQQPQKINTKISSETESNDAGLHKEKLNTTEVQNDKEIKNAEKSLEAVKKESAIENRDNYSVTEAPQAKIEEGNVKEESANKKTIKKDSSVVSTTKTLPAKKQKTDWRLGLSFSGGTSFAGHSPLNINKSADFLGSPATGGSSQAPNYYLPSKSTNSLAFTTGVFIQKDIFAKSKISIGLNYKYFSTKNKVGNKIDSISPNYYDSYSSVNPSRYFYNKFHFLEVPVTFNLRLNPKKSLPVYWNAGISISQLISTNALQFKSDGGIYYNDNSLFNKTQFGLSTGISATLFSRNNMPVNIGPYFLFDVTRLAGKGLYNKTHFSSIGISGKILVNKK